MHELGIAQSILKGVLEKAKEHRANEITLINVKVGQMKKVSDSSLQEAFSLIARGTLAEGAELRIELVPGDGLSVEDMEAEI
ncbi:hydrogenase maturation nickel metallochaperone HypA [candidate division NPL-UPA2 bacterium]|nr:hydrogenase maturation nickel metallochaperone HypA [candidate division NPL-UPA2 bacterium]